MSIGGLFTAASSAPRALDPIDMTCACNGVGTVALYYVYADVKDPIAHAQFQRELCGRLGLRGKVCLSRRECECGCIGVRMPAYL
jgi:citrate lyase beta subunit